MTSKENERVLMIAQKMFANDEASRSLGIEIEEVSLAYARFSMTVRKDMMNGHGLAHGGFIFLLADSAFAFACNSHNQNALAQHCSVTYIAPAHLGDRLTAEARERQKYGRSGIYDVAITNQSDEIIAEFRGHSRTIAGLHIEES